MKLNGKNYEVKPITMPGLRAWADATLSEDKAMLVAGVDSLESLMKLCVPGSPAWDKLDPVEVFSQIDELLDKSKIRIVSPPFCQAVQSGLLPSGSEPDTPPEAAS